MIRKFSAVFFSILLLLPISVSAEMEIFKIGYVVVEKILKEAPQTAASNKKLEKEFKSRTDSLQKKVKAIQKQEKDFNKNSVTMSAADRQKAQKEIQNSKICYYIYLHNKTNLLKIMSQTRRSFIAALALGTTTSAFPLLKEIETLDLNLDTNDDEISDAKDWVSKVKGSKKIVYDGTSFNKGFPIHWNWAFYQSNIDMKVPENDITAITVFRSMGISPAFKSALWEKYGLGEFFSVSDPKTGKPSIRNFTNIPQKGDLPAGGTVGISEMLEKGSLFCVCGTATKIISGIIAKRKSLDPDKVFQDFKDHIIEGIQIVPTGVWALGEVQAKGCGYIYAG